MLKGFMDTKLFTPLKLGDLNLKHRVIMAPLTRVRSPEHIPNESVVEYYRQRASDGGLLISEATHISVMSGNFFGAPGIYTPEQKRAWKKVTDAVHEKGGLIVCQLWHTGRSSVPSCLGGRKPFSASATKIPSGKNIFAGGEPKDFVEAQEMSQQDILDTIEDYIHAAKTAMQAGFDGLELHCANGYLLDQFLCDNINLRTDMYGGSVEKRARLVLEIVDALCEAVGGSTRVGIRFSPYGLFNGTASSDPVAQYSYVCQELDKRSLAYIHFVEPRSDLVRSSEKKVAQLKEIAEKRGVPFEDVVSMVPIKRVIQRTPILSNGEYNDQNIQEAFDNNAADGIVFGRLFISNPDLPQRLKHGWKLSPYDRRTFYTFGPEGYTDYPPYDTKL